MNEGELTKGNSLAGAGAEVETLGYIRTQEGNVKRVWCRKVRLKVEARESSAGGVSKRERAGNAIWGGIGSGFQYGTARSYSSALAPGEIACLHCDTSISDPSRDKGKIPRQHYQQHHYQKLQCEAEDVSALLSLATWLGRRICIFGLSIGVVLLD